MYLPISMSYNMLIRSLLWFVKYRFIILLFCAIYCYLSDYLLLNFITNCEKKKLFTFLRSLFFLWSWFLLQLCRLFCRWFCFFKSSDRKQQKYVLRCSSCWECVLIENLLSNLLHLINVGNNVLYLLAFLIFVVLFSIIVKF